MVPQTSGNAESRPTDDNSFSSVPSKPEPSNEETTGTQVTDRVLHLSYFK